MIFRTVFIVFANGFELACGVPSTPALSLSLSRIYIYIYAQFVQPCSISHCNSGGATFTAVVDTVVKAVVFLLNFLLGLLSPLLPALGFCCWLIGGTRRDGDALVRKG